MEVVVQPNYQFFYESLNTGWPISLLTINSESKAKESNGYISMIIELPDFTVRISTTRINDIIIITSKCIQADLFLPV